jgi:hypothetical protein
MVSNLNFPLFYAHILFLSILQNIGYVYSRIYEPQNILHILVRIILFPSPLFLSKLMMFKLGRV